jgi:rhodanese-related sulfurtransferase
MAFAYLWLLAGCSGQKHLESEIGKSALTRPVVIDVRTVQEYKAGHVQGSTNVPLDQLKEQIASVASNKNTPIMVHCQSGRRSAQAKKTLIAMGYSNVEDLGSLAHAREVLATK